MVKVMMVENNKRYMKEVEGRPVSFAGFTNFSFVLHPSPENDQTWRVSEATTGLFFASELTPNKALRKAKSLLLDKGRDGVKKAIAEAEERYGYLPWEEYQP